MNQFSQAQKHKHKMTPLPWGGMIFPHPLISFHQKSGGGTGKRMGPWWSCDVMWSDRSHGDGAFEHARHTRCKHTEQVLQSHSLLSCCTGKQQEMPTQPLQEGPGGHLLKVVNSVDILIALLTSICPGGWYFTILQSTWGLISVCDFGQVTWPFIHVLIHLMNVYWVPSVCQTLYKCWVYDDEQMQTWTLLSLDNEEMGIDNV